jgi:hypothetical protein
VTRLIRRENLISAPGVTVGTCDGCGHTFPLAELTWSVQTWQTPDLRCGEFTGTLCWECDEYAWVMCWRCGRLTSHLDGLCDECEDAG